MPRVRSSLIVSLVKSYYDRARDANVVFGIGLNKTALELEYATTCSGTEVPGCVGATYEGHFMTGSFTAKFSAKFAPPSDVVLTKLSLATIIPGSYWPYQLGLVDMDGFSIQLVGNTQYSISLEHKITYPLTI